MQLISALAALATAATAANAATMKCSTLFSAPLEWRNISQDNYALEKKGYWFQENHGYINFRDGHGAILLDGKPAHPEHFNRQVCATPSGKGYMGWGDGWGDHHHWPAGHFQLKRDPTMCLAVTSLSGAGNYLQLEKCHYNDGPQQARQFFAATSNGLAAFTAEKGAV